MQLAGYYTTAQVMEKLGVSITRVYQFVKEGKLPPPERLGAWNIWKRDAVDNLVAQRIVRPPRAGNPNWVKRG
jgi:predicted DNA-binding transcriptional regulator AlpA